jgi:hypothetical protein
MIYLIAIFVVFPVSICFWEHGIRELRNGHGATSNAYLAIAVGINLSSYCGILFGIGIDQYLGLPGH